MISKFKPFKIKDLFFTPSEIKFKKYSSIPQQKGSVAFISAKEVNNGIATYCNLPSEIQNCITVSTNGECLKCFFHNYKIIPSSDVEVLILRNKELTPEIACYINACIEKHRYKFNHSNKPKNGKVYDLEILLPVDELGNPDWKYIAQYIKEIEAQYIKEIEAQYIKEIEAYLKAAKLNNYELSERERDIK